MDYTWNGCCINILIQKLNKIGIEEESHWKNHAFRQSEFSKEERKEADEKFKEQIEYLLKILNRAKRKFKEDEEKKLLERIKEESDKLKKLLQPDMLKTRLPFFSFDWANVRTSIRMDEQLDVKKYLEIIYPRLTALFNIHSALYLKIYIQYL